MDYALAIKQAVANKGARYFPQAADARLRDGKLFPFHAPKFPLRFTEGHTVFTIGSCFARNIEEALMARDVSIPTLAIDVPKTEWGGRANGILNEFNPGSISQRILYALGGKEFSEDVIKAIGTVLKHELGVKEVRVWTIDGSATN